MVDYGLIAMMFLPILVLIVLKILFTPAAEEGQVSITGALVYSQRDCSDKVEINTADLPAGIYFIRLTTQNATEVRRFVKK